MAKAIKQVVSTEIILGDGQAQQSVKSFKQQLKEANNELLSMSEKFGATSKEAAGAAKRVAELKDTIGDAKALAENFNPDRKFQALSTALRGAATGFQAVTAAQALFGSESEELSKQLVKVQAAMAFSDSINNVLELKDSFGNVATVIKTNVISAFTGLRGAMLATGIGAFVVAAAAIYTNWDSISKSLKNSFPQLEAVGKFFSNIRQQMSGFIDGALAGFKVVGDVVTKFFTGDIRGAIDAAKGFGAKVSEGYNKGYDEKDAELKKEAAIASRKQQLDMLEAQGKDVRAKRIELMKAELSLLDKGSKEYTEKLLEVTKAETDLRKDIADKQKAIADKAAEEAEKKKKKEEEAEKNRREVLQSMAEERAKAAKEEEEYGLKLIEEQDKRDAEKLAKEQKNAQELLDVQVQLAAAEANSVKQKNDAIIASEKKTKEDRLALLNSVGNALGAFSNLLGRETAAGKALAIAQATMNTWVGATEVLRAKTLLPEPFGTITKIANVSAIIASGLKSIKEIAKVQVPGGGGGGGSISTPEAPQLPQIQQQSTQLDQSSINAIGNAASRVFITETDITGNLERQRRLSQQARLG